MCYDMENDQKKINEINHVNLHLERVIVEPKPEFKFKFHNFGTRCIPLSQLSGDEILAFDFG